MSRESSTTTCTARGQSASRGNNISSAASTVFGNLRIPSFRLHARDGFDMRTPIMSDQPEPPPPQQQQEEQNVIDLTEETSSPASDFVLPPESTPDPLLRRPRILSPQRSPRSRPSRSQDHDIIDLDDEEVNRPSSPDIQFLSSRARSRSLSIDDRQSTIRPIPRPNPREIPNPASWAQPRFPFPFNLGGRLAQVRDQLVAWEGFGGGEQDNFNIPNMLDFQSVGFDLDHPHRPPPAQPRLPTYEAPPEPREGFTRSSKGEDYVMVCVNCEDELGAGEDEVKRQVWFVRACGHVCPRNWKHQETAKADSVSGILRRVHGKSESERKKQTEIDKKRQALHQMRCRALREDRDACEECGPDLSLRCGTPTTQLRASTLWPGIF